MMRKAGLLVVAILAVALLVPAPAKAAFPERDITLIVPWAPGGGTDTLARTLVKNGKKFFGVNINVQNVTGGTGAIGMNQVARAKADGYTVALITFNLSTYRLLGQSELSYRDFDLIALLNRSIAGLAVKADSPFKTLKDLVDYAKANPGVVTVGHSGPAGAWHLAAAAIAQDQGLKFTLVPFDGAAPTRTALVGGHITVCASGMDEVLQFYQTKQVRILAANAPTRHPAFPDVPTMAEAGYPIQNMIYRLARPGRPQGHAARGHEGSARGLPEGGRGPGVHRPDGQAGPAADLPGVRQVPGLPGRDGEEPGADAGPGRPAEEEVAAGFRARLGDAPRPTGRGAPCARPGVESVCRPSR